MAFSFRNKRTPEHLTPDEIEKLLVASKRRSRNPERDYCMLLLMFRHALRVSELCSNALSSLTVCFVLLATPLRAQFVYVANFSGNSVSAYSISSNGALIQNVPGSPFAAGTAPFSVAIDPTGKFVYVANILANNVSAYSISSNGALTQVSGSPFKTGIEPASVAVDPTGKFAYVANANDSTVSAYSIGPTGALTPVPGPPVATGQTPVSVAVDPTSKFVFVYVVNQQSSNVSAFSIDPTTGALTALTGSPFGSLLDFGLAPNSIAVDPTGQFAYVVDEDESAVSGFRIDPATGNLGEPLFHLETGAIPVSITVDPTDKFAYVANSEDNTVSGYTIDSNGALTPVPGSAFLAGVNPCSVAISPLVPFFSSLAKLEISAGGFQLNESFTLGNNSNGINPVTENVSLQIGNFSATIPPGSFRKNPNGRFAFLGVINGVSLQVQIVPLGNNMFTFNADGTGVHLTGLTNPVTVVLTIGIDSGTTTATAEFQ